MKNMVVVWLLYAAIFAYSVVDGHQTKLLLDLGAYEANPLMRWVMDVTGTWVGILIFKLFWLVSPATLLIVRECRHGQNAEE